MSAAEERAAVVAWLRAAVDADNRAVANLLVRNRNDEARDLAVSSEMRSALAKSIERGDHLPTPTDREACHDG